MRRWGLFLVACERSASGETASNFIRRHEFIKAMKSVGASYVMLNHADHLGSGNFDPTLDHALACLLSERSYGLIVTHGKNGEYGHPQHRRQPPHT